MKGFIEVTASGSVDSSEKTLVSINAIQLVDELKTGTVIVFAPFPRKKANYYAYLVVTESYSEVLEKIKQSVD